MDYKRIFIVTMVTTVLLLVALGAFVGIIDPYQQYHSRVDAYCGNQRSEIGGVARNHDYDAIITGSSMSMNHYPEQVDSLWGWKTKNFSIMGATFDDYEKILPFVISQGKVKNIILNIDVFSFARERGAVPEYLYDDNIWNDYEYLYNYTSLESAINYIRNPLPEKDIYHFSSPANRNALKEKYRLLSSGDSYEGEVYDFSRLCERFDESLLKIFKENNGNIKWWVYFPPYSIGEFMLLYKYGDLDSFMKFKKYAINSMLGFPCVKVYDFQVAPWINNLDEYMDVRHHSHKYNRNIIKSIYEGKYEIKEYTPESEMALKLMVEQYKDSL